MVKDRMNKIHTYLSFFSKKPDHFEIYDLKY